MEEISSQLDLFLTEVSIELLGNKMYDLNGKRQDKIVNLFKALPENGQKRSKSENSNDFLCSIGLDTDFTDDENTCKEFLSDQLGCVLQDANTSDDVNQQIISSLRSYKTDKQQLANEVRNLNINKGAEKVAITKLLNESRDKSIDYQQKNSDKETAMQKYYQDEKDDLLKMTMDTIRLIKYILNDSRNEQAKGELIGYIHAMRIVKDKTNKSATQSSSKPYQKPSKKRRLV